MDCIGFAAICAPYFKKTRQRREVLVSQPTLRMYSVSFQIYIELPFILDKSRTVAGEDALKHQKETKTAQSVFFFFFF